MRWLRRIGDFHIERLNQHPPRPPPAEHYSARPGPENLSGGGGLDPHDPIDVAAMYYLYTSPELLPAMLDHISALIAHTEDEPRAAFWTQVYDLLGG